MAKNNIFYIFTYSLKNLSKSKSVRFVYVLKGRNDKGMVEKLRGRFLAPGCFIIPKKSVEEMIQIFNLWKVKFKTKKVMLTK